MARQNDLDLHILSAGNRRIEIINLKPQKDAVAVGLGLRVAYGAVVMLHVPAMELQDEPAVARHKPLVFRAPVRAPAAKQPLIPATAGLNVMDTNQRLWTHTISDRPKLPPLVLETQGGEELIKHTTRFARDSLCPSLATSRWLIAPEDVNCPSRSEYGNRRQNDHEALHFYPQK